MRIREYSPTDLDALKRLHAAQGFGYSLPDLESPLLITKLVLEEDDGSISMAVLLRLTAEAFLLHGPGRAAGPVGQALLPVRSSAEGRTGKSACPTRREAPRERWQRLLAMHEAVRRDALARGLDDVSAFLPPRVARAFGRRLLRLGWRRDPWACYCRSVKE